MPKYNPVDIEKKWQKYWDEHHTFSATEDTTKKKFYALIEFPYPSGAGLHVGHSRPFTAMDVIARKHRMQGENVLYPIGFDAFGLPTENFAIKTGRPPADVTAENIATFTRQLKASGFSFDWSRVIDTTDPAYFKWTQWLFLQFYKHGLAYKKNQPINWCPKDKIGLANEEVINGCCERCGTTVEKRNKEQWMLAITKYADKLLKGLENVDYIPQAKTQQQNWIGKSEGALVDFRLQTSDFAKKTGGTESRSPEAEVLVKVFTTRPDTIYGVTFIAVSPELAKRWIDVGWAASDTVKKYITDTLAERSVAAATRDEQEKTGIDAGITALNPLNGEVVPVWITNYVMGDVGTGAIMGVPAHDDRDFAFAKKYQLPIKEVVEPLFKKTDGPDAVRPDEPFKKRRNAVAIVKHWSEDKYLCFKWKKTDWRGFVIGGIEEGEDAQATALREIAEETGYTSAQFVRSLGGTVHAQYYQLNKQENRWAHFEGFLFQLKNGDKKEVAQEEKDIQDAHWISKNDVENFLSWVEDMKLLWHRVLTDDAFGGEGIMVNSGEFNGLSTVDARNKIIARLEELGVGNYETQFKLRDWVFSRQRYWGEPIPLVFCEACATNVKNCHPERSRAEPKDPLTFGSSDSLLGGSTTSAIARNDTYSIGEIMNPGWIPLPDSTLPLELPKVEKYEPTDTGESPLAAIESWVKTTCPRCGGNARRETDTMPNWAGSSWYFLAYALTGQRSTVNGQLTWNRELLNYWMPIDWYNGGMEHTVLHLLYSRFWNQFLFDIGLVPTSEPYQKRTSHGLILAKGGEKMSKSKGNVVSPDDVIKEYGADTLRTYIMFMGPFDQPVEWDMNGLVGVRRFLERTWNLQDKIQSTADSQQSTATDPKQLTVRTKLHQTIKKITEDIEVMRFNTAVAKLMELINVFSEAESLPREYVGIFARLLSPFAPHLCEELWQALGNTGSISTAAWPTYDPNRIADTELTIAIQINGKVRDTITVPTDATEETIKVQALGTEKVKGWLEGKELKKVIYVKGKLISIVA